MTERHEPLERPSPLRDDPELGELLRQATLEYAAELDEPAAFRRLELARRGARSESHSRRWPVLVVALVGGAAALSLTVGRGWRETLGAYETIEPTSEHRAPLSARSPQLTAPELVSPRTAEHSGEEPATPPEPAVTKLRAAEAVSIPKTRPTTPPERTKSEHPAPPPAASEPEPAVTSVDCLALARKGEPRSAERCFSERTKGSGLEAEMALYEAARLRVDVLDDGAGALAALSEHRQRFPSGSLRREVDMFRVELLARLGRGREALAASDELLPSASGERAAELHLLRGNVYRQDLSDPAAAELEYARAEALGGTRGARATYLRGLCFEALGNTAAAIASYQRYTSTPGRPQAGDALARLRRLEQSSNAAPPTEGEP